MEKELSPFELKEALAEWGYNLFSSGQKASPSFFLRKLVESRDTRLQEGFPVVFANWVEKSAHKAGPGRELDEFLKTLFWKNEHKDRALREWVALSLAMMQFHNIFEQRADRLVSQLEARYKCKEMVQKYRNAVIHQTDVQVGSGKISLPRLTRTFLDYVVERKALEKKSLFENMERKREFETEFYLSFLFSPKQKEILKKKLEDKPLTKTEKEYFSRTIRKRLMGIADPGIQSIARKLTQ